MKTKFLQSACFAAACILLSACVAPKAEEQPDGVPQILIAHKGRASFTALDRPDISAVKLFNGENFDGWYTFTEKYGKDNDVEGAFTVENGVMRFNGEAMGYLCTNGSYKDYYLKVVFRWGDKKYAPRLNDPRDSGVLYHFPESAQDRLWPVSIECQIQENDCGDYWCVGGTNADSPNESFMEGTQKRILRTANYENPNPEWNTIEIICFGGKSEHYVNGRLVNWAENLSVAEGKILLQLEGAEVFYKTVEMIPLK